MTLSDIDVVHERVAGTAKRNFTSNKNHLIKGVDYYAVTRNDFRTEYGITVLDKAKHSNKEVQSFRYNEKGRRAILQALGKM